MREYSFTDRHGFTFERIPKNRARIAYNNGLTVLFCPCNLRPDSMFCTPHNINKSRCNGKSFSQMVDIFTIYNCINSETGKYPAFYIPVEIVDRFTGELPTRETLGTVKQYDYKFMEV